MSVYSVHHQLLVINKRVGVDGWRWLRLGQTMIICLDVYCEKFDMFDKRRSKQPRHGRGSFLSTTTWVGVFSGALQAHIMSPRCCLHVIAQMSMTIL